MDPFSTGARLLSRGMRRSNGVLTLVGALLVARGVLRWLDGPREELVFSKRLKPGERVQIGLVRPPRQDNR